MQIPLSAPDVTQLEIDAVTAVLHTPYLSLGPELPAFEQALARRCHAAHAVAVSSGTAGLHLSLLAAGVGPGDEVIVPSFTFIAVANAVVHVGAHPVFAEIDPVTLNLDAADVEARITAHTRVIIVVHTFGVPANMDRLLAVTTRHGITLIEDACEALGALWQGQPVGSFGRMAVFGFYPNKQITTGEGGAVLTTDAALASRLRRLRNQGRSASADWLDHAEPGYNYRLSELACALGSAQLSRLDEILARRAAVAAEYDRLLADLPGLERPALVVDGGTISWFVYVVRLPEGTDRAAVQRQMAAEGIATGRYFPPIHQQSIWAAQNWSLPLTERLAGRLLALPFHTRLSAGEQQQVAAGLLRALSCTDR